MFFGFQALIALDQSLVDLLEPAFLERYVASLAESQTPYRHSRSRKEAFVLLVAGRNLFAGRTERSDGNLEESGKSKGRERKILDK